MNGGIGFEASREGESSIQPDDVGVLADRPAELLTALTIAYMNFVSAFPNAFRCLLPRLQIYGENGKLR